MLMSGGLDSVTCAAMALRRGHEVLALTVDYGQNHALEIERSAEFALAWGLRHRTVSLLGFADMVRGATTLVEGGRAEGRDGIPASYVPARNTILIALGLSWAEAEGAEEVWIGANAVDFSGYPDCRPAYIDAWGSLAPLATRPGCRVEVKAPLLSLRKVEILRLAIGLGVDVGRTISCYSPRGDRPCGACDSCKIRWEAESALLP